MVDPKTFLPNWDSLTPDEQERLKLTHPAYFQDSEKRTAISDDIDFDGSSMISEEELNREYHAEEEDPLSSNGSLPRTEG